MNQSIKTKQGTAIACTKALSAPNHHVPIGLRTVAIFEFAKGMVVLLAGLGLLSLIGRDAQQIAEEIVTLLHLNPARHYPHIFLNFAENLTDKRLWLYSMAAMAYAGVRFIETYGLWHERPWAEWFAVLGAGLYLPVELLHLFRHPGFWSVMIPVINIGIIIYLARLLVINAKHKADCQKE